MKNNWQIKTFGEIFTISAGGDIDKKSFSFEKNKKYCYPVYANAIANQGLYGYSDKYKIDKESLTITARGDIGKIFYRRPNYTPIVRLIVCLPKDNINIKFMSYACSKIKFINETTGVPQLTVPNVKKYKILVPPLAEQEKIVSILSKQDEVIEKLEDLIELKVKQKKGLMQKLLSGKVRLPKILPLFEGEMSEGQRGSFFEGSESAKLSTPPPLRGTSPQSKEGLRKVCVALPQSREGLESLPSLRGKQGRTDDCLQAIGSLSVVRSLPKRSGGDVNEVDRGKLKKLNIKPIKVNLMQKI